jgi:hypothetical protein
MSRQESACPDFSKILWSGARRRLIFHCADNEGPRFRLVAKLSIDDLENRLGPGDGRIVIDVDEDGFEIGETSQGAVDLLRIVVGNALSRAVGEQKQGKKRSRGTSRNLIGAAKKLGWQTCLKWSVSPGRFAWLSWESLGFAQKNRRTSILFRQVCQPRKK